MHWLPWKNPRVKLPLFRPKKMIDPKKPSIPSVFPNGDAPFFRYLFSLQSGGNFVLLWLLVGMCIEEPIWHCGEFRVDDDSDILFSTHCEKVTKDESKRIYSMFSCLAILLYWTLLCLVSNLGYVIHVIAAYVYLTWYVVEGLTCDISRSPCPCNIT